MINLNLEDSEAEMLKTALAATITQLDEIMENNPSREVADASNTLMDVLDKLNKAKESNEN